MSDFELFPFLTFNDLRDAAKVLPVSDWVELAGSGLVDFPY